MPFYIFQASRRSIRVSHSLLLLAYFILSVSQSALLIPDQSSTHSEEREQLSIRELLESHGLDVVAKQLASFITIFDHGTTFFTALNNKEHFELLKLVMAAGRDSFTLTADEVMKAKDVPSGEINLAMMQAFLERQEVRFREIIKEITKQRSQILQSEWSWFLGQVHNLFDAVKYLYKLALEAGLSLNVLMLQLLAQLVGNLRTDLLEQDMFNDLLRLPLNLKDAIQDHLEHVMTSDYGPFIKIIAPVIAQYEWKERHENREL